MTHTDIDVTHIGVTKETTKTTNKYVIWLRSTVEHVENAIRYFDTENITKHGSLKVVGTGIKSIVDISIGAEAEIRLADKIVYFVADPVTQRTIHRLNANSESLYGLYGNIKPRLETYKEMVEVIMGYVRMGLSVCAVFYGNPSVFAWSTHEAIRRTRKEGFRAEMMPAVSAYASLLADLSLDPSIYGI